MKPQPSKIAISPYGWFCLLCFISGLHKVSWREFLLSSVKYRGKKDYRYNTHFLFFNKCQAENGCTKAKKIALSWVYSDPAFVHLSIVKILARTFAESYYCNHL